MRKLISCSIVCVAILIGATGGYMVSDFQHQEHMSASHHENYTDRGRVCIEAASMIRIGAHDEAREYLESSAVHAIRGVPMGRKYSELLPKSQVLMVSALRYDQTYDDVDMGIEKLMRDIPDDHPKMSKSMRTATTLPVPNQAMRGSGEVGRFAMGNLSSPPLDR